MQNIAKLLQFVCGKTKLIANKISASILISIADYANDGFRFF